MKKIFFVLAILGVLTVSNAYAELKVYNNTDHPIIATMVVNPGLSDKDYRYFGGKDGTVPVNSYSSVTLTQKDLPAEIYVCWYTNPGCVNPLDPIRLIGSSASQNKTDGAIVITGTYVNTATTMTTPNINANQPARK